MGMGMDRSTVTSNVQFYLLAQCQVKEEAEARTLKADILSHQENKGF
jgi:hypothetical protein